MQDEMSIKVKWDKEREPEISPFIEEFILGLKKYLINEEGYMKYREYIESITIERM